MTSKWAERARSSPYYPALSHPVFREVLPGTAASALGRRVERGGAAPPAVPSPFE
ncbi:MAG TPA: hypothetical protein VK594_01675 [Streptosporangiaceae bacterium]|nr:hypothetical protein [Streptosporangiaceae bacterium]